MFSYELFANVEDENTKEQMLAIESAEISLDRALATYDVIMESQDLALREAELKCFAEDGDANTLMDYYEDATEKTGEKKKGVLATIWDKIIGFINKILGRTDKKSESDKYAADPEVKTKLQKFGDAVGAVLQFLAHPIKSLFTKGVELWKKIVSGLELITLGVAVFAGGKWVVKKIKGKGGKGNGGNESTSSAVEMTGTEINTVVNKTRGLLSKLSNAIKGGKDSMNDAVGDENEGIISKIVSAITKAGKDIITVLLGAPKWAAGKVKDGIQTTADKGKELTDKFTNKASKTLKNAAGDAGANEGDNKDQADMSSADDAIFGKDFAELLASEPYTESADDDELGDMLKGLI